MKECESVRLLIPNPLDDYRHPAWWVRLQSDQKGFLPTGFGPTEVGPTGSETGTYGQSGRVDGAERSVPRNDRRRLYRGTLRSAPATQTMIEGRDDGPLIDFSHPERLALLTLLLPMIAQAVRSGRRRRRDWKALGANGRLPGEVAWAWLAAFGCLGIALAGPRWGRADRPTPPGRDVVLAVDVSRSMAAEDATPNRLGLAVEEAESLVKALGKSPGDRVAVVAFDGRGVLRCPLTEHLGAASEALRDLRPGEVRPGGSDFGPALRAAFEAFDEEDHSQGKTVVIFSDGENHDGLWREALKAVEAKGIVVHAVTIGDAEKGHEIPVGREGEALTYQGETVLTKRSDEALGEIARGTGGVLIPLGLARTDLGTLYRERIEPTERRRRDKDAATDREERFTVFVGAASPSRRPGSGGGRGGASRCSACS